MVEQGCSPCGISTHKSRGNIYTLQGCISKKPASSYWGPPTLESFHHFPIVHPIMNPSVDQSIDEIRILTMQYLSKSSSLTTFIGEQALDLWETIHKQTMTNIIHCKREKTLPLFKEKITISCFFFFFLKIKAINLPDQESLPLCKKLNLPVSVRAHFSHSPPD